MGIEQEIKHIKLLRDKLDSQIKLWVNHHMSLTLAEYFATKDFLNRFQILIRNLDQESIHTLCKIIARLQFAHKKRSLIITSITEKEKERLNYVNHSFYTIQLSKDNRGGGIWFHNPYYLPRDHAEIGVFLDHHGISQFSNLDSIKEKDIIDVGGFIGDSALIFQQYTNQKIYTFEASNKNYQDILKTIQYNNCTRIIPINKGLGSKHEVLQLSDNGMCSSFKYDYQQTSEKVEIITLDSFVKEHKISVGLIKVDIEGFEMEFLKGALETIKTQKPKMILSIYHSVNDFFDIKPFIESLNLGYRFKIFKPLDRSVSIETCLLCECDE